MSDMNDRQKAFENKYALDQELMFKIEARTAKLFGLWIAEKLGLGAEEAGSYAADMVGINLSEPGFDDIKRAAEKSLADKNIDVPESEIAVHLEKLMEEAREQVINEA
ncbi:MAG: DUF1476 domain-containing protein [Micavibrio sp.]